MSPIERWGMSECPDCGVLTCATAEQVQWCDDHCRENPDTAGCDWPVPIPHTQAALDTALGGRR
jgi:hypothetical protein